MNEKAQLCIVLPVYNEGRHVSGVVLDWFREVSRITDDFLMLCIDDGSTDETPEVLKKIQSELGGRLEYWRHDNRGHGQTCLVGYREACRRKIPHVLQIDSDGQSSPRHFPEFWNLRHEAEVVCGIRIKRQDGLDRKIVSGILAMSLRMHGSRHPDANVPYRLMKTENLEPILAKIPENFHLANVALALLLESSKKNHRFVSIDFPPRNKPKASVGIRELFFRAAQLHRQLWALGL